MRAYQLLILLFALLPVSFSIAATPPAGLPMDSPESVGMSAERLQRIDAFMQRHIDEELVAGTVTLVARKGKVVHFNAQGLRDVDTGAPMTTDTIFRMASMSKPITSVALMMLYEEGWFQLKDPISNWLPEFTNMMVVQENPNGGAATLVAARTPITFTHIMTHTAGLMNSYRGDIAPYTEVSAVIPGEALDTWTQRLATLPLRYEPGTRWEYSAATSVAGRLVEVISGMSFDEYLRTRIFEPLQMRDTYFYLPEEKVGRFAAQYAPDADNGNRIMLQDPADTSSRYIAEPRTFFSGAGGLVSTAHDYIRFQQMMLNGGELDGVRILGSNTVEQMFTNHTGDLLMWLPGPGVGSGLEYAVIRDRGQTQTPETEGTAYWGGAFGTTFWIDREEELIGIMLTQIRPYSHIRIREGFRNVVYQAIID